MSFENNLEKILEKYNSLSEKLASGISGQEFVKVSKEFAEYERIVGVVKAYMDVKTEYNGLCEILADKSSDSEMRQMAEMEKEELERKLPDLEMKVKIALLPQDEADSKNAILEVRAGTGGDEAGLFAYNLFRMYQRYAELKRWKFEVMSYYENDLGGVKEASALISGENVYARLKFESGVHRVQRVPDTESSGRIHTSAATVAILPEAEEFDVQIDEKDLKIDTYRASGAGGQHVNTTDSAVRITHLPTGIVVAQQDERSQHKNKARAMKLLCSKIYEMEREKRESERSSDRKSQIGSGDRSERIRTYNFPQSRVTDHRINLTLHKIEQILAGEALDEFVDALRSDDETKRLAEGI